MPASLRSLAPIVAAVAIVFATVAAGVLEPPTLAYRDARSSVLRHASPNDVVIVEIDARSVRALDRWTWSRRIYAALIEKLNAARPRAVLLDVDLSAPSNDPAVDAALAAALGDAHYPLVLPAFPRTDGRAASGHALVTPLAQFADYARTGIVGAAPGRDGLVRGLVHSDDFGGVAYRSAVAILAGTGASAFTAGREYPIDYSIAPQSFPRVSYLNVLDGDIEGLAGKTVFVGATAPELNDTVTVPVYEALPGVVVQALAYATLREGIPVDAPRWIGYLVALLVCFTLPLLREQRPRETLRLALYGTAVVLLVALAFDAIWKVRLGVMPIVCAIIVTALMSAALSADRVQLRALVTRGRARREALISSVLSASIDGIVVFGGDGAIHDTNAAAAKLLGLTPDALRSANVRDLLPDLPSIASLGAPHDTTNAATAGNRYESTIGAGDAATPVEISITRVDVGSRTYFTVILRDITERKQQQALLKHQATHDALTGLPNRVLLGRALDALTAAAPAALFMLDLDGFKDVNDTLGHATGDAVLTILGQRLRSALPEQNLIARIGGDEFAVVVPSYRDVAELHALADIVLDRVRAPVKTAANTIELGASIGIALCPEHGTDGSLLLQRADVAMYAAKRHRTGVEFFDAEVDHGSIRELDLRPALRGAIANGELELVYQPQVRLSDLACVGVEALARWTHPELGLVAPAEFVALAEDANLIAPLTRWTLARALDDHAAWRKVGLDLQLAINLSARHLRDRAFAQELLAEIERKCIDPSCVELEIAETALMSDPEKAMTVLQVLTRAGIRVAMDDFGTGFSSLAYLKYLNLHTLKIDRRFIKDISHNANDFTIVRSTLRMAHGLDLSVVAEGIEEREHYETLRDLGCDIGQGYWISKPMPADQLVAWTHAWELGRTLQLSGIQAAG